jgi:hypothetical protein
MKATPTLHVGIQLRFVNPIDGTHVDDCSLKYKVKSMGFGCGGKLKSITLKKGKGVCTMDVDQLPAFVIQFD